MSLGLCDWGLVYLTVTMSWAAWPVLFCVEFAFSPHVCVGPLGVIRLPPRVQRTTGSGVQFTGDCEISIGLDVTVNTLETPSVLAVQETGDL